MGACRLLRLVKRIPSWTVLSQELCSIPAMATLERLPAVDFKCHSGHSAPSWSNQAFSSFLMTAIYPVRSHLNQEGTLSADLRQGHSTPH